MGARLTNTHVSKFRGLTYDVELHDNAYSGTPIEYKLRGDGFQLRYQGNNDRFNPIIGSKVTIGIVVENAEIDAVIDDLIGAADFRFFLKIKRTNQLYWAGHILVEQFSRENQYYPYTFTLTASDGLGILADADYKDDNKPYVGRISIIDHFFNCLQETKLLALYEASETLLSTSINWREANHTLSSNIDALVLTDIDHRTFYTTNEKGIHKYQSCFAVLKEICKIFGARLLLSEGCYRLIQINSFAAPSIQEIHYNKDKTVLRALPNTFLDITINEINQKLGGGLFRYSGGLGKVELTYKHRGSENLIAGAIWEKHKETEYNVGEVKFGIADKYLVKMQLEWDSDFFNQNTFDIYSHQFRIKMKQGNTWLNRTNTVFNIQVHGIPPKWDVVESYYDINTNFSEKVENNGVINISFKTPVLTSSGDLIIKVEYVGTQKRAGDFFTQTDVDVNWKINNPILELLTEGVNTNREDERLYEIINTEFSDNRVVKKISTIIGDGPNPGSIGKMQVSGEDTEKWSAGDGSENLLIQELLLQEILKGRKKTIAIWDNSFRSLFYGHDVLIYDSKRWIISQGTFSSNQDQWKGTWFEVGVSAGGTQLLPPKFISTTNQPYEIIENPALVPDGKSDTNTLISLLEATKNAVLNDKIESDIAVVELPTADGGIIGLSEGDTARIINPTTGLSETFLIEGIGPTGNLKVDTTFVNNYPIGSTIIKDILTPVTIPVVQIAKLQNQSGDFTEVDFDLPDIDIDEKLYVIRAGRQVFVDWDYTISNNNDGLPRIMNWKARLFTENIFIKLIT